MDSFDDKIKRLYEDTLDQNLPIGFDWEDNQAQIYSKMGIKPQKRRFGFWWLSGIGLLTLGLFIAYVLHNTNIDRQEASQQTVLDFEKDSFTSDVNNSITLLKQTGSDKLINQVNIKTNLEKGIELEVEFQKTNLKSTKPIIENTILNYKENNTLDQLKKSKPLIERFIDIKESKVVETIVMFNEIREKPLNRKSFVNTHIKAIHYANLACVNISSDIHPVLAIVPSVRVTEEKIPNVWVPSLSLGVGSLIGFGKYGGSDLRNEYSSWKPGYHSSFSFALKNQNGWEASIIYGYDFAVQYFDFVMQDSVIHTDKNVITRITTNAITGVSSADRGDYNQVLARYREFKTYNSFKSHSLGLTVGKCFTIYDLVELGINTGIRYSIVRNSSGHTLDNFNEVFNYSKGDEPYYKTTALDITLGLDISYKLSNNISLLVYSKANKSLINWSSEIGASYKPTLVQIGGGVKYSF